MKEQIAEIDNVTELGTHNIQRKWTGEVDAAS